ncbi:hypothetical protein [uncultured Methanomethylovorans sp.]|uniref:hypothetical protein n=1 Tax=uncultured Methanomethylovorans sp. TaxID=183759 RepID=UPI002AA70357|nr:hypothetical protein [uncultured Methanomethylovorans sp.]
MSTTEIIPSGQNKIGADVDGFSKSLESYLKSLGLPAKNVLVEIKERQIVIANMPFIIESLDPSIMEEAYYISKFIASCGVGLFDAALNYLWNETIVNLRQKIVLFDLDYFFNVLNKETYNSEEDLQKIEDWELIKGCLKVGILSDIGFKHLDYIRDMRNFASAAHPNNTELTGLMLANWLQTCINEVLSKEPSSSALQIKKLLPSVRQETLTESDSRPIISNIERLPQDLANSLLLALFGMYTNEDILPVVRNNIQYLAKATWLKSDTKTKKAIGLRYSNFSANAQVVRKKFARDFLILVEGLAYLTEDQRSIELRECLEALINAHYGHNNFYNEEPHAKIIYNYIRDNYNIPENVRPLYVSSILTCKLGNSYGPSYSAEPYYDQMIDRFDETEIRELLRLLKDKEFTVIFQDNSRAFRFKNVVSKLADNLSNAILKQALEKLKESSNTELQNGRAYLNIKNLIE